jgi:hypothetical protein
LLEWYTSITQEKIGKDRVFFLACLLDVPSEHQYDEDYGYIQEQLDGKVLKQLIDWQVMTP